MSYKSCIIALVLLAITTIVQTKFLRQEPTGVEYRRWFNNTKCEGKYEVVNYDKLNFCYKFKFPGTTSAVIKKVSENKIENHHFENTQCSGDDYTVPISQEIGNCFEVGEDVMMRVFTNDNSEKMMDA